MVRESLYGTIVPASVHADPLNVLGGRTVRSTPKGTYNCAGYALECFSWYCPRRGKQDGGWEYFTFDNEVEAIEKTDAAVQVMLEDFPTMRRVESLADVRSDEYAILFRLSPDGDFHYLKRDRIGHWRHKMGNKKCIETIKAAEIFLPWGYWGRYTGPVVIFAKQR